ncbi:hypothetical protein EON65_09335 [archaeon]|nr:MAG: hypothetical protein EON65_09335 [archaeon]
MGSAGRVNAAAKILEELNCCQQSGSHEGIWLNTLIVLMESLGDYAILAELIKNIDVVDTSSLLAVLSHVMNTLLEVETSSTLRESRPDCTDAFVEAAVTFLIVFHEQVSCGLLERGEGGQPDDKLDLLFFSFVQSILSSCSTLINELTAQQLDHGVKLGSPLVKLCFPVLCQLTSSNFPLNLLSKVVSALTPFLDGVCKACMQSLSCRESLNLLAAQMGSDRTSTEVISSEGGWKTLKSTFEDGDSSFNITDNGTTYTSVHSGNTCAIVPMKFGSGQRAAWEFLLETDSMADECSVFGAARMPLSSRCYSSSSDLWMRRSYNGYMYCQGQTTGNNMDKIHPGDVVRIEFDGSLGTLSYSVNGSELEVGFSDIVDEVHPACGSYRSGVSIKLLKVEVYEKKKVATDTDDLLSELKVTNPVWVYSGAASSRDPAVLCQSLPKDKKKVVAHLSWLSAKASSGARCGTHDFALELSDNSESSFCLGVMFGATLPEDLALGADFSQTKVSLHSSSPLSQPTLDYAFGDTIIDYGINHLNKYFLNGMSVYAWHSDGSLWFNGVKVCAAYGLQFLPLRKYTTVVVRIDRSLRFIEFLINGRSAGVAFGPSGVCKIPLPPCTTSVKDFCTNEVMQTVFPCASIYGSSLVLRIRAAGSVGSITVPTLLSLRQTTATTISRLATRLLEGNKQGLDEKSVISWLQSPLFIGGLDQDLVALIAQKEEWLQAFLTSASKDVRLSTLSVEDNLLYQLGSTSSSRELSPSVSALYEYLEKLDPDPVSLKNILERSGSYRFPDCELPFIACLLKQSGLIVEAVKVVETPSDGNHVLASEDLRALWQRVKQLRLFLRQKRQKLKNSVLNSNVADLIVETIEETNSSKLEDIFDISAHDLCLASITQKGFAFIQTVAWHKQENASCAGTQDGSLVTVHSVGLDAENKLAYVVASVKSHKALTSLSESTILIDGFELAAPVVLKVKDDGQYVLLVQKFNTATLPSTTSIHAKSDVVFCLLKGEFGSVKLVLKDAADNRSVGTSSGFEQLCHSVRVRSLLVLLLHSNMRRLDSHTKSILLGLTSKYSGASGLFRNKAELTRWKTQDRWKRVIEFLRVQSKASMHESAPTGLLSRSESLEKSLNPMKPVIQEDFIDEDDVGLLDFAKQSVSNTQTVLQACAVFVLSEDIKCSASSFISIIKTRVNRADYRIASLNALRTVLSHRAVESDPMVVFDILAGLENALPTGSALIGIQTGTESEDSHYLKHLEGCDGKKLREVQQAFSDFYLALSYTLSNYITYWDQGLPACADMEVSMGALDAQDNKLSYPSSVYVQPILQIMRLWTIRFSNRDFGWILSSGMLPNLCKLTSLTFFEKLALKWRNYAEKWFNISSTIDPIVLRSRKVSIWSQDFVLHSLSNHTLSSRALLLHLAMVVSTNFSAEENSALQLTLNDASIFMANLEEATEKYCKVQTIYYSNLERVLEDKRIEDTAREEAEKKISQEKLKQLSGCGTFDPDKKADEVNLEDFNRIASLRGNESGVSVCAYANICFDTRTNLEASGNYFEVKMQELGQGDIGVGFADNDTFPVREQMPGWISHSYGYHGDDGKKYGEHSTSGDFPLFEVGDVIGCGFDKDSRSIFYTRNGVLLGVGFENIEDDKLWPVIGFSNRHDDLAKVSINFGLEPFMYTAESILLNFNVAAELESRNTVSSTPESSCITVNEGGEEESRGESAATLRLLQHALQRSETQLFEHHRLKGVASLLLQFLLAICSQKDHDNDYDLKKHHEVDREIAKVPLVKDFSTFGTPKAVTIADESSLNESIVAALLHEVTVGVSYVVRICSQKQFSILELEDKLLGYEVSSEGRVHKLVLEVHEVQQCIIEHLSALNNLVESSRLIREELSTVKSLKCLFSCFSCSYSVQRLVMSILLTIIPTMDCDIIETAITPEWREKLNHIDSVVHALGSKRKQRRMPDSFIRIMLLEAAGIFKITSSSSSSSSKAAYGSSSDRIATHQSQMKLVHKLFGLPQWCELVASTVTEALRCAHQSLYVPDVHATSSIPIDDQFNLLLYGAASVCIFRLLPFEVAGAPVLVDGCGKGTIIYNSLTADKLRVVLDSSLHDFHCRQNVELVDRDKMRVAPESLVVDLSQLSQPVLAQMMQLIKQCCQALLTIDMKGDSFNIKAMTPFVKHVLRLSQSLLSALHVVLCKQTEVVLEFLHEADMIGELVSIAKLATYTSHISTFDNAMLRWMFMQSRWLDGMCSDDSTGDERSVTVAKDTTLESSNICELAVLEAPVEQESPYDDAEALDISSFARSKRLIEYQPVCEELGISPDICLAIAEYHGLDKEKTIAFFRETKESIKELDMTAYQSATSQSGTQNFIDDMNALSNVEYASLNSAREQSRGSSFFRRLVAADSSSLLRGDYVVAESTSEGLDSLSHGCVYNYISSTVDSIQVAAYLHETSSVISKLIKGSTSRRVIFYDTEIAEYGQSLLLSDWAAFVLSVRNTVLKLVVCGDVDLDKRVSNPQDALPLMKLLLVSAGDNSASTLRTVCKSFSTQGVTESDSGHIVTSLVLDAAKGLKDITGLSLMRETEQNVDEQLRPVLIRSTHPYTTPCKTSGKIAIPPRTTGLQIKFHPLCSTASDGAKLSFYMSKESYASRKPDHVYCGSDWATKYKPLGITSNKDLYFEFEALQNSDWPVLGMEHAGNFIKRDQDMISMAPCVNSGSVGLGDEDTLFNLFNDTVEPETASNIQKALVWPAGEPIRQGAWFFQVKIAKALSEEIFGELQIGILEDIPSASEEQITTDLVQKPGWVATSSGQIYICGAEQGSALRQWQDNDVLIIAIVVAESSYSIAFSMGEESSPIFSSSFDASKGLKPVFYLEGQAYSFEFNVGDGKPFFQDLPVHLLSLFGTQALNPLVGGLKAESSDARLQSNSSLAWGYEFVVEPLFQLAMELTRSFDLVWSYTNEDIKTGDASRKAWVWRAKSHGEYFPFGDILATSPHPPPRGILVHKSQCAAPSGFNLVFSSPKTNLLVWRPIAPEGYVALGDLVCSGSHPSPAPSVSTVVCLPLWALKECDLRECIMTFKRVGEGKNLTTASLWTIDHNFGLFFGSPYESRSSLAKRSPEFKCNGVGKSFTLATDVDSLVFAEWFKEEHVLRSPSLSWIVQLIGTLLEYSEWQPVVLTKDIFNTLVGYLKSSMAVFPHKVVSLLIQMVRLSGKQGVDLGLGDLRSLCKAILTEASTIMQKKSEIPKVLMSLIDLVIEIQTVNVVESSMKDCVTVSRSIEKEKNRLFLRNESKEERSDLVDSKEESSESVEAKCTKKWWERDSVSPQDMKVFRVIKYDNLDSIFFKESALLKLKQVLKFLHAINIPTNPDQPLDSFPVKLDRSFPKLMTSKLWFEKVSLSTMVESQHPYRDRRYHRVVHFPGAEKLTVTFDSRCSFCNGDKLLIKGGTAEVTLTALSLAQLEKDVTFPSDTLDVKLLSEEGTSSDISMHHEFGWAFLVRATGPIYETAESEVNLDELFAELRDHPVAEKKLTDISSDATVDKDLDTSDTKLLPLRREETAGTADTDAMDSSSEISAAEGAAEAPDISLFEMDSSLRPKSKRGKREKAAEANQEKSGEERKPLNVGDGALDEDVALLYKSGRSVRKGKLAVPYSSELDVKVSRGDLGSSADDYEMVLRMESTKGE